MAPSSPKHLWHCLSCCACTVLFTFLQNTYAAPSLQWSTGVGTDGNDHVFEGIHCSDRGFCIVGKCSEANEASVDGFVIKLDPDGRQEWVSIFGIPDYHDEVRCIVEVSDGFLIGGTCSDTRQSRACLWKIDTSGNQLWRKTITHNGHGAIRSLRLTDEKSCVATGYIESKEFEVPFISDESVGILIKTDLQGELQWQKELSVAQGSRVMSHTHTDEIFICGTAWRTTDGIEHQDAFLITCSADGKELSKEFYGDANMNQCFDCIAIDGGFMLSGHTTNDHNRNWDVWAVRLDGNGDLLWEAQFGPLIGHTKQDVFDECYCVKPTIDGGFVLACGSGIEPENRKDKTAEENVWAACLIKTDSEGHHEWTYVFHQPHKGHNACEWVIPYGHQNYLMLLDSDTLGTTDQSNVGLLNLQDVSLK